MREQSELPAEPLVRHSGAQSIIPVAISNDLSFSDIGRALAAGWHDFKGAPAFGLFFAAFYVIGGAAIVYALSTLGEVWGLIPAMAGFPLFAPFAAVGLYEVSRRREAGLPLSWRAVLGALRGHDNDQLMMMGGIVFIAFGIWLGLAHGIFAIFLGESGIGATSIAQLLSPEGIMMLVVGGAIGAFFAFGLYAITVMSLPMLVERDVDFITAIIVSLAVIKNNKSAMIAWALLIAIILGLALIPAFLGLFVALPILGHATWHIYRRATSQLLPE